MPPSDEDERRSIKACIVNLALGSGIYGSTTTINKLVRLLAHIDEDFVRELTAELADSEDWISFNGTTISIGDEEAALSYVEETREELYR